MSPDGICFSILLIHYSGHFPKRGIIMFELTQVGEHTFYFDLPSKIGVFVPDGKNAFFIDSGPHKDTAKKALRVLREHGFELQGILVTHAHADHIGGNRFLQDTTGCSVFASAGEADYTKHPYLEATTLYGGCPHKDLQHKFLLAQPCETKLLTDDGYPDGAEHICLPGHSYDMVGYRTTDNILFVADSICSEETLQKYGITFLFDVSKTLHSLDTLQETKADLFIPSHAPATKDIVPLIDLNRQKILETADFLCTQCQNAISFEKLLQTVFSHYGLKMTHEQHVLIGSTVRSYLSYLYDTDRIGISFEDNTLLYKTL